MTKNVKVLSCLAVTIMTVDWSGCDHNDCSVLAVIIMTVNYYGCDTTTTTNDNNNNNNNGDLYSALTKLGTTRFTIAMYE